MEYCWLIRSLTGWSVSWGRWAPVGGSVCTPPGPGGPALSPVYSPLTSTPPSAAGLTPPSSTAVCMLHWLIWSNSVALWCILHREGRGSWSYQTPAVWHHLHWTCSEAPLHKIGTNIFCMFQNFPSYANCCTTSKFIIVRSTLFRIMSWLL